MTPWTYIFAVSTFATVTLICGRCEVSKHCVPQHPIFIGADLKGRALRQQPMLLHRGNGAWLIMNYSRYIVRHPQLNVLCELYAPEDCWRISDLPVQRLLNSTQRIPSYNSCIPGLGFGGLLRTIAGVASAAQTRGSEYRTRLAACQLAVY
ncbi:hypothetical protein FKP32DRAFT_467174 [Trametes sanguinea]|nr:hypothetical protein FKP32DRAFT_467174 [Trametes sanguinea]